MYIIPITMCCCPCGCGTVYVELRDRDDDLIAVAPFPAETAVQVSNDLANIAANQMTPRGRA